MTISRNETQCSIWSILIEKNVVASGIFWPQRNKANHNKAKFGLTAIFEMSTLWLYVWAVSNALNVHLKLLKYIKKRQNNIPKAQYADLTAEEGGNVDEYADQENRYDVPGEAWTPTSPALAPRLQKNIF